MNTPDCARTRARFDVWLDGQLDAPESTAVADHLATCVFCASALGEDIRLGTAVEDALRSDAFRPPVPTLGSRLPFRRIGSMVAAALVVAAVSFTLGRKSGEDDAFGSLSGAPFEDDRLTTASAEELGVFMPATFARAALSEAEREAFTARLGRLESQRAKYELELAARRRAEVGPVDAEAVVRELARQVREADTERRPLERRCEVGRRIRGASRILARDRSAGVAAAKGWLAETTGASERSAAVRLLSTLGGPTVIELLVVEARSGTAREAAIDGLGRSGDESVRPLLAEIADDAASGLELVSRALAGLHRLGDPAAAERLIALSQQHDDPDLRRRIVYALAARPTVVVGTELPGLAQQAGFDAKERRLLAEMVAGAGGEGASSLSERLRL